MQAKKLQGIADLKDLTDRSHGLRLVIEIKNGFNPDAMLEQLYRLTPMEDSFGINNVALVEGQPRTLGLRELLQVYVDFRIEVVRRRTQHRLTKREERLHLVDGLLIAIVDIDEVIQLIRGSDDAAAARARLMEVFDLTELQADVHPGSAAAPAHQVQPDRAGGRAGPAAVARSRSCARSWTRSRCCARSSPTELADVAKAHGTPRRTVLLESAGAPATAAVPLEVADDPCWVLLSSTGLLARTSSAEPLAAGGDRQAHDAVTSVAAATARGEVGLVTSRGRVLRLSVLELPALPPTSGPPSLSGGAPLGAFVDLPAG